jgi:uncharacterized protein
MDDYFLTFIYSLKLLKMKHLTLVLVAMITLNSVKAQQQPACNPFPKTITVTGTSEMEIIPDEIYVHVDLREYKKRGDEKVDIELIKAEFLEACKSIGIPDSLISIASYEGMNAADWWRRKKKDPNLFATISYQLKFNNSKKMDDLVEKLNDEATSNFRIIKTWHSKMNEYRKQLKIAAVKAAQEKGIYLTRAIGETLGNAVTITEPDEASLYQTTYQTKMSNTAIKSQGYVGGRFNGDGQDNGVDFKKLRLQFQVSIVFALQ